MIYQRLSLLSETSWSAAACQNARAYHSGRSSLDSAWGSCTTLGHAAEVDKNYHPLSQVETVKGLSFISVTKA
jgi:hypothetical protein